MLAESCEVNDVLDLGDDIHLVSYRDKSSDDGPYNINVAIASAVTAYARIFMSIFKNNLDYNLYYTDTDSIFVDKPLPD